METTLAYSIADLLPNRLLAPGSLPAGWSEDFIIVTSQPAENSNDVVLRIIAPAMAGLDHLALDLRSWLNTMLMRAHRNWISYVQHDDHGDQQEIKVCAEHPLDPRVGKKSSTLVLDAAEVFLRLQAAEYGRRLITLDADQVLVPLQVSMSSSPPTLTVPLGAELEFRARRDDTEPGAELDPLHDALTYELEQYGIGKDDVTVQFRSIQVFFDRTPADYLLEMVTTSIVNILQHYAALDNPADKPAFVVL